MAIPKKYAKNYKHLIDLLYQGCEDGEVQRNRCPFVFRGVDSATFHLETTLMRLGQEHIGLERHLLHAFQKYAHRDINHQDDDELLSFLRNSGE